MDLDLLRVAFSGRLLTDAADMAPFLTDWRGKWTGHAIAVAQPDTTRDVAEILRWCHAHRVPVVPQGGNTGLSGGATPDDSGRALVLSLARLKRVRRVDVANNTIEVEAGVTLQEVQDAAREAGRLFPLSLAAQGSCTIGGNLATNAGGVQVLRYGNARELCLGLEVVTPSGDVWDGLRGLRKDNTGYDLRDLFIGAEGTLGVITAAVLKLFPLPAAQVAAFVAVPTPAAAVQLLQLGQSRLGAGLTAFELISETCLGLVEKHVPSARRPLTEVSPWYVLIELSDTRSEADATAAIEALLEAALEQGLVTDAAMSASLAQFKSLWALREDISESQGAEGKTIKHDIALPISRIADFIAATDAAVAQAFPGVRMVVFGHLGDGNLHYNVSPAASKTGPEHAAGFMTLEAPINRLVHDAVVAHGGSISAEHGLGVLRRDEAARYKSSTELSLMWAIKRALDPLHLMNPGKLLGSLPSPETTETPEP
jgi:FAD/FMN-containing dehydrogenase